ncbi:MAG: prepilin-type N-terminal cleavage/methylation domain-containing protein [Candidatus Gracilibacteria bacterium]|nr:prepilin-type N-terminal cleavage/methylation domain-containing protein [Candidatus Gracilibacteria bacterium]
MVQKKQAFTLVELIVTIVILAILGAIAFISFQGYSRNTRDSTRIADINLVQKSLAIFMTKTGFYPNPDNSQTITYNGGEAWIEGTIGENVIKNIQSVSKKTIDPLTSDEFTYSITAGKTEYQIGSISEAAILGENIINKSYAADISKVKALIRGTYNEKFLKVETGGIQMLLVQPSIIVTDIGDPDLTRLIQNKKVVYNSYDNIPHSYNHNNSMTGGFDYEPGRGGDIVVLSGTTLSLTGNEDKVEFISNVQDVLSGTILDGGDEYAPILDLGPTDNTGSILLVDTFIRGDVGGITGIVSDIPPGTTSGGGTTGGEEEPPTTCSLTQTQLDELNYYLGDGSIEVYNSYRNKLSPSTEEEWCNAYSIYWYGGASISSGIWNIIGLNSLNLSRNNLTTLPSQITNLTNLSSLYLGGNSSLGSLSSSFDSNSYQLSQSGIPIEGKTMSIKGDGTKIVISIKDSPICTLTSTDIDELNGYKASGFLKAYDGSYIYRGRGYELNPTTQADWCNIVYYITFNGGTTVPSAIGKISNLMGMSLNNDQLTSLPSWIGNLTDIQQLNVGSNQLTSLPSWIGNLKKLTTLDLSENNLTTLPSEIGNITNLTSLRLYGNQLTSIPIEIGNLTKLTTLILTGNPSLGEIEDRYVGTDEIVGGEVKYRSHEGIPTSGKTTVVYSDGINIGVTILDGTYFTKSSCLGSGQTMFSSVSNYSGCNTPDIILCTGIGTGYTIAACNVGTNISGTGSSSYGDYFQWGRNKGFPYGDTSQQSTKIDGTIGLNAGTDTYGFVRGSTIGGVWANTDISNNWGGTAGDNLSRQGPCASGYHVPSNTEWIDAFWAGHWGNDGSCGTRMMRALNLPLTGNRSYSNGNIGDVNSGYYWISTPGSSNYGKYLYLSPGVIYPDESYYNAFGFSVRCFKN